MNLNFKDARMPIPQAIPRYEERRFTDFWVLHYFNIRHNFAEATIIDEQLSSLCLISKLLLYPAITTLGIGIFIGAIWANVSWGQYWSWDPKEVWALITFMFYAIVIHKKSLPIFNRPLYYHIYTTVAFAMILMTYFGVNYFLGGMHSYA